MPQALEIGICRSVRWNNNFHRHLPVVNDKSKGQSNNLFARLMPLATPPRVVPPPKLPASLPYVVESGVPYPCRVDQAGVHLSGWALHQAAGVPSDLTKVTVWSFALPAAEAADSDELQFLSQRVAHARDHIKRLKTTRFPGLLRYLDDGETKSHLVLVTERVVPLALVLTTLGPDERLLGVHSVLRTLCFLHDECGVAHNNLCLDALVFSPSTMQWRVTGLDFAAPPDHDLAAMLAATRDLRSPLARRSEHEEAQSARLSVAVMDAPALAFILQHLFVHPSVAVTTAAAAAADSSGTASPSASPREDASVPSNSLLDWPHTETFRRVVAAMTCEDVSERITAEHLLQPGITSLLSDGNVSVRVLRFVDEIQVQSEEAKEAFFKSLAADLRGVSSHMLRRYLAPKLLTHRMVAEPSAAHYFLPSLLMPSSERRAAMLHQVVREGLVMYRIITADQDVPGALTRTSSTTSLGQHAALDEAAISLPRGLLSMSDYSTLVPGFITSAFLNRDRNLRIALLHLLPYYIIHLPSSRVLQRILPAILEGIHDSSPYLVIRSFLAVYQLLRTLLVWNLAQHFGTEAAALITHANQSILPQLCAVARYDSEPLVRARTLQCLPLLLALPTHCRDQLLVCAPRLNHDVSHSTLDTLSTDVVHATMLAGLDDEAYQVRLASLHANITAMPYRSHRVNATVILPAFLPLLCDAESAVRSYAQHALRCAADFFAGTEPRAADVIFPRQTNIGAAAGVLRWLSASAARTPRRTSLFTGGPPRGWPAVMIRAEMVDDPDDDNADDDDDDSHLAARTNGRTNDAGDDDGDDDDDYDDDDYPDPDSDPGNEVKPDLSGPEPPPRHRRSSYEQMMRAAASTATAAATSPRTMSTVSAVTTDSSC